MAGGLFDDAYGPATATPAADSSPAPASGPEKSGGLFDDAYGPAPDAGPADAPPPADAQHKFRAPAPASPYKRAGMQPQAASRGPGGIHSLHSYSSAETSEPRTADSAGHSAATSAAPRMIGNSISASPIGKRYGISMPLMSRWVMSST